MEDILIIAAAVLVAVMLALICVYNYLDRRRFFIDRLLGANQTTLDAWAKACGALSPGADEAYCKAKRNWERTAHIQRMVDTVKENSIEKLELQESLLDFCFHYNELAQRYNRALENPLLASVARLFRFRPYTLLDFFPDIQPQQDTKNPRQDP